MAKGMQDSAAGVAGPWGTGSGAVAHGPRCSAPRHPPGQGSDASLPLWRQILYHGDARDAQEFLILEPTFSSVLFRILEIVLRYIVLLTYCQNSKVYFQEMHYTNKQKVAPI